MWYSGLLGKHEGKKLLEEQTQMGKNVKMALTCSMSFPDLKNGVERDTTFKEML